MRVLITGSAGFLGQKLYLPFIERGHAVVRSDISDLACREEFSQGDLVDYEYVQRAVSGVDAIVIAHMSPRREESPSAVFSAMGCGTLNLFHAAMECGVSDVCLISSIDVTLGHPTGVARSHALPPRGRDLYGLGKSCQEHIAEHYARIAGLRVSRLRIGYVVDGPTLVNKYGKIEPEFTQEMVDRHDVGEAACRLIEMQKPGCEAYYVLGASNHSTYDTARTWRELGWQPRFCARSQPARPSVVVPKRRHRYVAEAADD